ncbi:MAG: EamA family transporter [Anaerolineales bacterium]
MLPEKIVPALEAAFASVVWGISFVATQIALTQVSLVIGVWIRFALGVLILGATVLWHREFLLPPRSEWGYFALLGFIGITFPLAPGKRITPIAGFYPCLDSHHDFSPGGLAIIAGVYLVNHPRG